MSQTPNPPSQKSLTQNFGQSPAVRCEAAKANSFRPPSTQWCHVGFDPGLVDKDQALWIKTGLPGSPASSPADHINAALFKSEQRFF
jgi:hypothetical protein